jgi:hypothetical protein
MQSSRFFEAIVQGWIGLQQWLNAINKHSRHWIDKLYIVIMRTDVEKASWRLERSGRTTIPKVLQAISDPVFDNKHAKI